MPSPRQSDNGLSSCLLCPGVALAMVTRKNHGDVVHGANLCIPPAHQGPIPCVKDFISLGNPSGLGLQPLASMCLPGVWRRCVTGSGSPPESAGILRLDLGMQSHGSVGKGTPDSVSDRAQIAHSPKDYGG
ncbi:hypothetical protein F5Y06DRAFT_295054 [Hypoxylon sp. FL0890]|nr:hypothetical protein F5Y06DRAFT_295054 [Hypoxylon sp. FL0890]